MRIYEYLGVSTCSFDVENRKLRGQMRDYIYPEFGMEHHINSSLVYPFSARGYEVLKDYVEWTEEIVLSKTQKIEMVKIPEVTADDLDLDVSICDISGNMKYICSPQRLVFKSSVPGIFKIGSYQGFCTEEVKELIEQAGLTGFSFSPVFNAFTQKEYMENPSICDLRPIKEYEQDILNRWEEEDRIAKAGLTEEQQELLDELAQNIDPMYVSTSKIEKERRRFAKERYGQVNFSLSGFMRERLGFAVDLYVPAASREEYYTFVDEFVTFRNSSHYVSHYGTDDSDFGLLPAIWLLHGYRKFTHFHANVADYLQDHLSEMGCYLKWNTIERSIDPGIEFVHLIATRVNAGDEAVIRHIKGMLRKGAHYPLRSNDGIHILRAVTKSKNIELHDLLCEILNDPELYEELCHQICYALDDGRPEVLQKALVQIAKNQIYLKKDLKKLLKMYATIWTFAYDTWRPNLYPDDILPELSKALEDPAYARALTETDDCTKIQTGLTAIGFYEVREGLKYCFDMLESATRRQLFAIACYATSAGSDRMARVLASRMIRAYSHDPEIISWFLPAYFRLYHLTSNDLDLPYSFFADPEEDIDRHYQLMKKMVDEMDKNSLPFPSEAFPGLKISLKKKELFGSMTTLAYLSKRLEYMDDVRSRFPKIKMETYEKRDFRKILNPDQSE